jgi:hypothetical protein
MTIHSWNGFLETYYIISTHFQQYLVPLLLLHGCCFHGVRPLAAVPVDLAPWWLLTWQLLLWVLLLRMLTLLLLPWLSLT